ncbi:MAG: hypothetical protein WA723_03355 [Pseudolabrys sp.]|jgi:hypothetical protein
MRFRSMQLREGLFSCAQAMKLLAADSHVLAFAAVTRASTKWQARHGIARIFHTELSHYGFARLRSGQNANAAQQAEPVRIPKRTQ